MCRNLRAWSSIAATTLGCEWPVEVTAMPAVKSRNSLPSTSVIHRPSPFATASGYGRVKLVESAALSRPTSAAARGPGRLAATFGRLAFERTEGAVEAATLTPSIYVQRGDDIRWRYRLA